MKKTPVLVIMAAGIGSRYGAGVKQLAKVGPSGEIIMDYSLYDAREAGFRKVIFVIRRSLEKDFREVIGDRIARVMDVEYAFQEIDALPEGFSCPAERNKPWGTGHAVLVAKKLVDGPFAVINADDYYGRTALKLVFDYLAQQEEQAEAAEAAGIKRPEVPAQFVMAGFVLRNTLSSNGGVTRGVCMLDEKGNLSGVQETGGLAMREDGRVFGSRAGETVEVSPDSYVSMNMWGFTPALMEELDRGFRPFLQEALEKNPLKEEYLLPGVVDRMLKAGTAGVKVLPTPDTWFGITYREDKEAVTKEFTRMVEEGLYPTPLFG